MCLVIREWQYLTGIRRRDLVGRGASLEVAFEVSEVKARSRVSLSLFCLLVWMQNSQLAYSTMSAFVLPCFLP